LKKLKKWKLENGRYIDPDTCNRVELGDWVKLGDYKAIICAGRDYRGYEFIGAAINNKLHIWAGCHKEFPFKDALEHWSHRHSNELELRADILSKVEYIRLEAVRRGWEI
jgi:hypothetical protein